MARGSRPAWCSRARLGAGGPELAQRVADDPVLLAQVRGRIALTRARAPRPAGEAEADPFRQGLFEAVPDRAPGARVLRLLLSPDQLFEVRERADERGRSRDRKRVELLQA